jgi:hypothetical protein
MLEKVIKIFLIVIMLLGITFSISNLFPGKIKASGSQGIYYMGECMDMGNQCDIGLVED